ncbi:MAG: glutamate 5-kinase [Chthoniobacterales bacterium]|nr:glutamate 5-kinase [Chthoniobacterales bacterium]
MKRLVIKLGTGVLSRSGRALETAQFRRIAQEVTALQESGISCVLVSSAAIAAGVRVLGLSRRPDDLPGKQACAAAGQPELMRLYAASFRTFGRNVAQLLLTHDDIDSRIRRANARNTLHWLLKSGPVVPVINENDSVAVEELRFGDNDRLSAEVAQLIKADYLAILTSVDGIQDVNGKRVSEIRDLSAAARLVRPDKGAESVGGMKTKLEAVRLAVDSGIPCSILDGRKPGQIAAALAGGDVGTRFPVSRRRP